MSAALVRKWKQTCWYTAPTLSRGRYVFTSIDRFISHGSSRTKCPAPRESVGSLPGNPDRYLSRQEANVCTELVSSQHSLSPPQLKNCMLSSFAISL